MPSEAERPQAQQNTDVEIWRGNSRAEFGDDDRFYADSLSIPKCDVEALTIHCGGYAITRPIREWHRLAAAPSPASRDDAVRLVDRMTCPGCGNNEPVEQIAGYEAHRYTNVICRRKVRAIIAALAEKGLLR